MTLSSVAARTPDGHTLFDNLSLAFGRERTGLVGRNGVGKTTLLRLIEGLTAPAEGTVTRAGRLGVLAQRHEPAPGETVADTLGVVDALAIQARILAGGGSEADMAEADWTLDARMDEALGQTGLAGLPCERLTASLSGGEQTRLRLAALLMARPELLILDEPTNNLDAGARQIVAKVLGGWKGGAVVVSHDRSLLRQMDRIVELSSLGAAVYGGDYDAYEQRKALERAAAERELESAQRQVKQTARAAQTAVERKARRDKAGRAFRARASEPKMLLDFRAERAEQSGARDQQTAARLAAAADAALSDAAAKVERGRQMDIPMPPSGLAAGRTVLVLDQAGWATPEGRQVLKPISLRLTGAERVAVTGRNGAGKTTLLKLMTGALAPTTGRVEWPVPAALMDQHVSLLRSDETLLEAWLRLNPGASPNDAHAGLARFLFRNVAAHKPVSMLSGGERLRAGLACVMTGLRPPQLLILDEPTNHLDLDSLSAVEAALRAYDGALVVVSHDADFLDAVGVQRTLELQ
ncbi:ABC-F family ATP-binding cassette domain-containing protein [Brevundimonas sp.]|uniref:ABC-F family ATP-binding cassette domain-containing protein n=1 Tax=Brevundimonas sp. TaxID=1871086 RepID=UPI0025BA4074|nr:ABC-F family ATP-binding cassette domain-containing protein [Brevundimonas sp.]